MYRDVYTLSNAGDLSFVRRNNRRNKTAVEMTVRGNPAKPNSGFPMFPPPLEIALRFPHSHRTATTTLSFPLSKHQNSLAPSAHATTSNKETGKNPRQFPIVYKNASRAVLRRFPYSLFFVMDGDELLVIACFHASRDPSHWQRRT